MPSFFPKCFLSLLLGILSFSTLLAGAQISSSQPVTEALRAPSQAKAKKQLTNKDFKQLLTAVNPNQVGLPFQNVLKKENIRKYLYVGAGGCAGDFDSDGLPDLFLICQDGPNRLFRQKAPWQFEDVTQMAGVGGGESWGCGATSADVDNDGDLDLYVCNFGSRNQLFLNQGDGTFVENAKAAGLDLEDATVMASFVDIDRDGDLDVYLLTYLLFQIGETETEVKIRYVNGRRTVHPDFVGKYELLNGEHLVELGLNDRLYQNNGDGTFTDISLNAGMGTDRNHGLSANWWDHNNDGWPDLYVASDFKDPDRLWSNRGDNTFQDVLPQSVPYTPWFAMGSDFGDINRDGWFDYTVADMSAVDHYGQKMRMGEMTKSSWFLEWAQPRQYMRNTLYVNGANGHFFESGYLSGIESTGWTWAMRFADLDCDGWEDLLVTNGMPRDVNNSDHVAEMNRLARAGKQEERKALAEAFTKSGAEPSQVFRNRGDLTFEDVSAQWGYNDTAPSFGLITADLDRDGDLDLIVNNMNAPVGIYRNDVTSGHRLLIQLRGRQSNHFGVGARVRIKSPSGWQSRILTLTRGYASAEEPVLHFGLGEDKRIERIEIDWPSGARQILKNIEANQLLTITEPEGQHTPNPVRTSYKTGTPTLFSEAKYLGLDFTHQENNYNDFSREPLLPWSLSRLGPGLAWGDANGDGREDVYIGGASGQTGRLFLKQVDGSFKAMEDAPWHFDAPREELGAILYDTTSNGLLDLYVANGGSRYAHGDGTLEDQLYLNLGEKGFLHTKPDPDPSKRVYESSSVVAAADADHDGDIDLFVGARHVPGKFPDQPKQRLLRNTGAGLEDATDEIIPELRNAGMVTSALWSDIDNDADLDLLVTTTWGPVRVYTQKDGTFKETTQNAGTASYLGWWQGIEGADFDGDGDIDYVATNMGHNSKYEASEKHPVLLYANDFDGDGKNDLVEAHYEGNTLFPVRGLSCSSDAMPGIRKRFKTFDAFAKADLPQIYTQPKLKESRTLKLTHLDSSILINDGEGHFTVRSLPLLAQIAPGFGVVADDFDGDGHADIVIAQNFYSPQPETGRMSGGLSLFLKGDGKNNFEPMWPDKSGISLPGDSKALTRCDLNDDGVPDLLFSTNNGPIVPLINQTPERDPNKRWTTIELKGKPGNPTAIGSRINVTTSTDRHITQEIRAGGGYLSQSTPRQFLALDSKEFILSVDIHWPDQTETKQKFSDYEKSLIFNQSGKKSAIKASPPQEHYIATSTREMADRLTKLNSEIDYRTDYRRFTSERANLYRQTLLSKTSTLQNLRLQGELGYDLLKGGQVDPALAVLLPLRAELGVSNVSQDPKSRRFLDHLIATAHFLRGEQENCLSRHNPDSCLFPIKGEGIHQLRQGSEGTIAELKTILEKDNSDLKARWMLNLAYMTLGEYPQNVPEPWRIDPSVFASETTFSPFTNRSTDLHLDHRGLSGGVILEDFDRDGGIDVLISAWGPADQIQFWHNELDGTFANQTLASGLKGETGGLNICHADYNNDSYPDILILRGAWFTKSGKIPNSLLRNNGDGTFDDVTEESGLLSYHPTQVGVWGDYNNDGWIDLFVGNESTSSNPHPCELFRNNGDGTFTNVAEETGLAHVGFVKGAAWGDYDNDGDSDLYVSNMDEPNTLYQNDGENFSNVTKAAGVSEPDKSFPTWFFDYDNDGWLDLFVAPFPGFGGDNLGDIAADYLKLPSKGSRPRLYQNQGDGTFKGVSTSIGLDHPMLAMGANYGDLDNDGWLDFYIGTGEPSPSTLVPNRMYRNDAGKKFQNITTAGRFGHLQKGHGIGFADMDNDGDQDVYAVMGGAYEGDVANNAFFLNPGNNNHWITLQLEGTKTNRLGIGVRICITVETKSGTNREIHRTVSSGGSFGSSSLQQEIGLGDATAIREIKLFWPASDTRQKFTKLKMNRNYTIKEGSPNAKFVDRKPIVF